MGRSPRNITHLPLLEAVCTAILSVNCTASRDPVGERVKAHGEGSGLDVTNKNAVGPFLVFHRLMRQVRQHGGQEIHRHHPLAVRQVHGLGQFVACLPDLDLRLILPQLDLSGTEETLREFFFS